MAEILPTDSTQPAAVNKPEDQAIIARELSKQFGDELAVRDLSFQMPRGSIFGFIGPSGSGKTTTIRLLTGIYEPSGGDAVVLGSSPKEFSAQMRERIGYMPQLFVLYPDLTIIENMNFTASLYGMGFIRRRKRIQSLLDFVELTQHQHKLARNISGGMQRRLALATTLVHNPELIFLDEPTAGVDPVLRNKFWDHFRELRDAGHTLFITTQYVGEAAYCDYVGIMANGTIIMVDTPEGLRRRAFGGDVVDICPASPLDWQTIAQLKQGDLIIGSPDVKPDGTVRVRVDEASTSIPQILDWLQEQNIQVDSVNEYLPPFDDVFVTLVQREVGDEPAR